MEGLHRFNLKNSSKLCFGVSHRFYLCNTERSYLEASIVEICHDICERYEIHFVEIGLYENHVHFLIQSVPVLSVKAIVQTIKSITAKEVFRRNPEVKKELWGGAFWKSEYYVNTVGQYASEDMIRKYILGQGKSKDAKEYKKVYSSQLRLFE